MIVRQEFDHADQMAREIVKEWDSNNGICLLHDHQTDLEDRLSAALREVMEESAELLEQRDVAREREEETAKELQADIQSLRADREADITGARREAIRDVILAITPACHIRVSGRNCYHPPCHAADSFIAQIRALDFTSPRTRIKDRVR